VEQLYASSNRPSCTQLKRHPRKHLSTATLLKDIVHQNQWKVTDFFQGLLLLVIPTLRQVPQVLSDTRLVQAIVLVLYFLSHMGCVQNSRNQIQSKVAVLQSQVGKHLNVQASRPGPLSTLLQQDSLSRPVFNVQIQWQDAVLCVYLSSSMAFMMLPALLFMPNVH
jgi:hypothetical protein